MISPGKRLIYLCLLVVLLLFQFCKKKSNPNPSPVVTLKSTSSFPIGAAISTYGLNGTYRYKNVLITEFNSISTDFQLKFDWTEPNQGKFNYTDGDNMVAFASQNHMRVHAHNLIWHQALPTWVLNFSGDSLAWENLFKTHIEGEANHYKGQVTSWDVVNEAFRDDDGTLRANDKNPGDGSIWGRHLGKDYIARAFQYAHEADPNALLFYNDYGQEWSSAKLDSIISMVSQFKKRGIPISGLGIQLHIDINANNDGIKAALQKLAATGLFIHVSELDISVNPASDPNFVFTTDKQLAQSTKYQFVASTYKSVVPIAQQYGITTWEFSDADSWIPAFYKRKDYPLPFDSNYDKKPAYYGLINGLK